jgi:hypothetical protein
VVTEAEREVADPLAIVSDLDVAIDLRAGAERPGDGGAHDGVVGEHDRHPAVD